MGIGAALITAYGSGTAHADDVGSKPSSSASTKSTSTKSTSGAATVHAPQRAKVRQAGSVNTSPTAPVDPPSALSLVAVTRRDSDGAPARTSHVLTVKSAKPVAAVSDSTVTPAATPAVTFTGQPSLVTQVLVVGLRLLKPVIELLGINVAGSGASIPLFTDGIPPPFVTTGLHVSTSDYNGWKVWTLTPAKPTDEVVIGIHGGAFTLQASIFHWITYANLARTTGATVIVPLYPLANAAGTGGTALTVIPTMADFIAEQVTANGADNVSVLGDSAGGTIALAAAQELVRRCQGNQACLAQTLPGHMVLLSPALDLSSTNPNVGLIDDPLLSLVLGSGSGAASTWTKGLETADDPDGTLNPLASPLFGSLDGLPPTTVYAGSLDLTAASVLALQQKAAADPGTHFTFVLRKGEIHDWITFPLPESLAALPGVARELGL
jgi:triacylglycerol lipase